MSDYAWIIDEDRITAGGMPGARYNAKDLTGPSEAPVELVERLRQGEGEKFRMRDDDGEIYYYGRFLALGQSDENEFGPLDDFGKPNAGCTEIQYLKSHGWEPL